VCQDKVCLTLTRIQHLGPQHCHRQHGMKHVYHFFFPLHRGDLGLEIFYLGLPGSFTSLLLLFLLLQSLLDAVCGFKEGRLFLPPLDATQLQQMLSLHHISQEVMVLLFLMLHLKAKGRFILLPLNMFTLQVIFKFFIQSSHKVIVVLYLMVRLTPKGLFLLLPLAMFILQVICICLLQNSRELDFFLVLVQLIFERLLGFMISYGLLLVSVSLMSFKSHRTCSSNKLI